jgi:hypothetical protein
MDTFEARMQMRDLGREVLVVVERVLPDGEVRSTDIQTLRRVTTESRALLSDAGYPAEGVWRAIQRASIGMETHLGESDRLFWSDILEQLRIGVETLESLVTPGEAREPDFRIVG